MFEHTEQYRGKAALFILCQLIDELEEHIERLERKYGSLTLEEIRLFATLAERRGDENAASLQLLPEYRIGTTPVVVRAMRRCNN